MPQVVPPPPRHPPARGAAARLLLAGLMLGALTWGLSQHDGGGAGHLQLAMAFVIVVAGSASAVFFGLHATRSRGTATLTQRAYRGTLCVACGILIAIHGLNLLG